MVLTMKNYKGFNKQPYCSAHYPQLKATTVESTPEQDRLKKNTEMSSGKVYRKDFEENIVGHVTSVADDPETQRVKSQSGMRGINYTGGARQASTTTYPEENNEPPPAAPQSYVPTGPPVLPAVNQSRRPEGPSYRAMYDYDAQDQDEVSFQDGDIITDCEIIDEGWILGTVQKTGQRGMIPSNYVEEA
jgi:hypothetical protein